MFEFEWDPAKAASNARKHGVSFADAATVFGDVLLQSMPDNEHGDFEQRWISQGRSRDGQLLVVIHIIPTASWKARQRSASSRHGRQRLESGGTTSGIHEAGVRLLTG